MSGIKQLRSTDLAGLVPETAVDSPPRMEVLGLGNTSVDDDATQFLSACTSLRRLDLSFTKVSSA
jgi:hypothetical protein